MGDLLVARQRRQGCHHQSLFSRWKGKLVRGGRDVGDDRRESKNEGRKKLDCGHASSSSAFEEM